jgi:hypothetical protein
MHVRHALVLTILAPLVACSSAGDGRSVTLIDAPGGGSGGGGGGGGGGGTPDAPSQATCLLSKTLGAVTPTQQEGHSRKTEMTATAPDNFYLFADLNQEQMPDILLVDLWAGYGAFTSGFPTGPMTVQLTGEEASYETCGACITVQTDYTMSGPTGDPYIATAGTLNLTSANPTSIAGSLSNVTFTHVTVDDMTGSTTPHADGCSGTLTSVSFQATPMPDTQLTGGGTRWKMTFGRAR